MLQSNASRFLLSNYSVIVDVLLLGMFCAFMFSILSCFPPFSLILHTALLSKNRLAYPVSSPWSFSYHPTLYHLPQQALTSECMTSSLVFMSLQLIFSILILTRISNASSLQISFLLYLQVSTALIATLHVIALIILFFMSFCMSTDI